uniref:Ovule protein n=1 Tax=Caenorhabditis tropicalis TaxID=1561998 RepID=A0A1I7TMG0_9PELO
MFTITCPSISIRVLLYLISSLIKIFGLIWKWIIMDESWPLHYYCFLDYVVGCCMQICFIVENAIWV